MDQRRFDEAVAKHMNGLQRTLSKAELTTLRNQLGENEQPLLIIPATYEDLQGVVGATESRVIVVTKKVFSIKLKEFAYTTITSVEQTSGLLFSEVTLQIAGGKVQIKGLPHNVAKELVDLVRAGLARAKAPAPAPAAAPAPAPMDPVVRLERLMQLKQVGAISDAEFETLKRQIMVGE